MELCTMVYKPTYDPMVWLPPELVDKMLKYLDTSALLKIAQLSKPWRRFVQLILLSMFHAKLII